jgi:tetratricopeptide (TPR) repeat protein
MRIVFAVQLALVILLPGCSEERGITTSSDEALQIYNEGVDQWEKFYYREARQSFEHALRLDSSFAMAWARLGFMSFHINEEKAARDYLAKALSVSHHVTDRERYTIRMWLHHVHYRDAEAAEVAETLIRRYPRDREAVAFRGVLYEREKNLDAAIRYYQQAVRIDTGYARGVMLLGYAYSTIGEQDRAIEQMQRYIQLAPNAADPRASYADLLLRVGRYDEALEQYRQSLELKPDYWYSINQIGRIYMIQGRLSQAMKEFERGLRLVGEGPQIEATLFATQGEIEMQRGKYELAIELYDRAFAIDSTNLSAAFGTVHALIGLGRFGRAAEAITGIHKELERRGMLESPAMQSLFLLKARLAMEQMDYERALAQCDSAIDYSTALSRPAILRQLAEIRLRLDDFDAAFVACEEALSFNPNNPSVLMVLTKLYKAKGDELMTQEIGNRLLVLWKEADKDFKELNELRSLLAARRRTSSS